MLHFFLYVRGRQHPKHRLELKQTALPLGRYRPLSRQTVQLSLYAQALKFLVHRFGPAVKGQGIIVLPEMLHLKAVGPLTPSAEFLILKLPRTLDKKSPISIA